ncbi:SGNH/GDSL hydrolase family protein [Chamaesiphon minutus]|uniref:Phospholipase/lecithinase/hemolysin n=1 Tax=Chamaesiphon minutus (strain ATCC 27169 / PCC 6605) TaxID=1173020 RepID=K9UBB8_CHAP6|nr:SGNH/GDSL hydrolase family protein [Chamaesiphon minutus]AFY91918.1 phospholipase/lecithinase/hemolysin [Chamaesiphon minutus PCC 6605]
MKIFLIVGGLLLGYSLMPVRAIAATFSQIVVYGDSLSDVGNAAAKGAIAPYKSQGRFSNGKLWIEYLADRLGIGIDRRQIFAEGGATTGTTNVGQDYIPNLQGISQQVKNNPISDPKALYVIWGGANDYLRATPASIPDPKVTLANLNREMGILIARGAKNILVVNLPNLGTLPSTRNQPAASQLNLLTQAHNAGLAASIDTLRQTNSGVKLILVDVNTAFSQAISDPRGYGFDNVTDGCFSVGCKTPNTYLFWDSIHPTTAGHKIVGDLAFQAVSVPTVPPPTRLTVWLSILGSSIAFKRKLQPADLKENELIETN